MRKKKIIGSVPVDSGMLMIIDPCYVDSGWKHEQHTDNDFAHDIYRNKVDGKLWQYTYGAEPIVPNVNKLPGSYEQVIPEYGLKPNELIAQELWEKTEIDPVPHIDENDMSYRAICKARRNNNHCSIANNLGICTQTGWGDGEYPVYAEYSDDGRVSKIIIDFQI